MHTEILFIYGTLLHGESNHHIIEPYIVDSTPGSIQGRLFSIDDEYPAAILELHHGYVIEGEWVTIRAECMPYIDELEDYEPNGEHNLYERVRITDLDNGSSGWIYVMTAVPPYAPEIHLGSWREYRRGL